jgi:hypothetical protein
MNPERSKLRYDQQIEHDHAVAEESSQALEFSTVDDLLRHDNEQNPVPEEVGERLNRSIAEEPKPVKPWYRNLFGSRS